MRRLHFRSERESEKKKKNKVRVELGGEEKRRGEEWLERGMIFEGSKVY